MQFSGSACPSATTRHPANPGLCECLRMLSERDARFIPAHRPVLVCRMPRIVWKGSRAPACGIYQALIFVANHHGPTCATTLVWLVPLVNNLIHGIFRLWSWLDIREHMDRIFFQKQHRSSIDYIQNPLLLQSTQNFRLPSCQMAIPRAADWYHATIRSLLLKVVRCMFLNVALFSRDL